ncbi:MAG: phosphotransferase [Caldilineaceae bacterium]
MNSIEAEHNAHLTAILAHWELPPLITIAALQEKHSVYKITTNGPSFILKDISDAPNLTRLEFTHQVLTHVAHSGLYVPTPLAARSAALAVPYQGRFYLLTNYIEARPDPFMPEAIGTLFYDAGEGIARLHQALASYVDPEISRKTWREELAGRVVPWISALSARLPESQAEIVKRLGPVRSATIEAALRSLPEQLIHRDCHPGNILLHGTRVIGFIDCDHICIGPRLFDLAYYAVHHLKWVTDDASATTRWLKTLPALLNGYQAQLLLSPQEVTALPAAMMAYHLLLANWFMQAGHQEPIAREVQALDWLDQHFEAILDRLLP